MSPLEFPFNYLKGTVRRFYMGQKHPHIETPVLRGKPPRPPTALQQHPTYRKGLVGKTAKATTQRQPMAIGRISIKTGSKGKGRSHANYILRQDKYKTHSAKSEKLEHTSHGNMPQWANDDPSFFWKMADEHERKNGSVYREHILTLPRELNQEQRLELVKDWIRSEIGDKHPYTFAIHNPLALDGKEQPHCHLMFCERELDGVERGADTFFKRYNSKDPSKGGAKKANTGLDRDVRKAMLKEQRTRWGDLVNKHLEKANSKNRVDMRNWKERGLQTKPINISMKHIQLPHVKQAYQAKLNAKIEYKKSVIANMFLPMPVSKEQTQTKPQPFKQTQATPTTAPVTVAPKPQLTYKERMRISERMAELMQFDSLDPDRIPQSFIDDLAQYEPSRLDYTHNHYSDVIKKSYEIIQERDLTDTEKENHKTAVFFSRAIDRVKQLASAIKEKFTAKAEPEPVAEIVRSDESKPQLTPTPEPSPEQLKQAKLLALMQQNQESERQAKLEQQQAQLERQARLERQQAQLEAIKNKQPEPEQSPIVEPQHNLEPSPTPPLAPEPTIERLEMVSIDPRLKYETRKSLEQLKAHIEAMPNIQRQNLAISEFNKVVGEQLEQQQSQSKGMDR